jgi:hypothetical protein
MYTRKSLGNDASTFNFNKLIDPVPEKFRLPGVKVWKDSDSVIIDATKFKPKPIKTTAGARRTLERRRMS